jgi:DNA-directed RNA polymerase specialized sigma24 family protein
MDARTEEITYLLKAWGGGDKAALVQLTEHVYPELRRMARRHMKNEAQGNSLQATALVHEVYLRLVDVTHVEWQAARAVLCHGGADDAAHSGGCCSHARCTAARWNTAESRPGRVRGVVASARPIHPRSDEALTAFSHVAPRQAKVVELRYFGGLKEEEIVAAMNISPRTVRRDWDFARAWLLRELSPTMVGPSVRPR